MHDNQLYGFPEWLGHRVDCVDEFFRNRPAAVHNLQLYGRGQ
jgi:hypothetical protein